MSDLLSLQSICDQRRARQNNIVPPIRMTLINPYITTSYTKLDLDMRRKAEILKYNINSNGPNNNLTKSQKWALLVNGNASNQSSSVWINNSNGKIVSCPTIIQTPLSSCNVPPDNIVKTLYYDESVLLYNYISLYERSYDIISETNNTNTTNGVLSYTSTNNVTNQQQSIFTITFLNNLVNSTYIAKIQIPMAISVSRPTKYSNDISNCIITINSTLNVLYNDTIISPISIYNYTFESNSVKIIPNQNSDLSNNVINSTAYIGLLSIENVELYSQPDIIYTFTLTNTVTYNQQINNIISTVISNISSDYLNNVTPTTSAFITPVLSVNLPVDILTIN